MCPAYVMPSLGVSSWPCYPLETTPPEFGQPRWLAMAPGQKASLSTSPAQVDTASVPDLHSPQPHLGPQPRPRGGNHGNVVATPPRSSPCSHFPCENRSVLYPLTSPSLILPSAALWPPEEEDSGGLHVLLTVTPVGLMLLIILAALGFFYGRKR